MRATMTSTFTGASVSRIDIEPVSIEALGLRLERRAAAVPADRRVAGMAKPDQRLRLARGELAGIVAALRVGHAPAERREVAARARRRAGGGEPRLEEQRPAEPDEGGVLDRPRRWTPVLLPQRRQILRREGLRRNAASRRDDAGNGEADRRREPAS